MDRARIRVSYTLAAMVTAKRIEEQTKTVKPPKDLTSEDFEKFGPYLMYASVDWQQRHIEYVLGLARQRERAQFLIPASKIITYKEYINREGEEKPIVNTDDQVEGLHFPPFNETHPPKRIVMVSHPAHLMRILHILGKYPDSIPQETTLQLFPIPTPKDAVTEYAKAEILGTLGTIFRRGRATFVPYANYEL
jgi:tryptophan 2,3-dioxygenase